LKTQIGVIREGLTGISSNPEPSPSPSPTVTTGGSGDRVDSNSTIVTSVITSVLTSVGLITFITSLPLLSRKLGQPQPRRNRNNSNPQARSDFPEKQSYEQQQPEDSDQTTIYQNYNSQKSRHENEVLELGDRFKILAQKIYELKLQSFILEDNLMRQADVIKRTSEKLASLPKVEISSSFYSNPQNVNKVTSTPPAEAIDEPADKYRKNPSQFTHVETVALDPDTFKNLRQGKDEALVLFRSPTGNCWVIRDDRSNHYLVPSENFRLTEKSLDDLKNFYEIQNEPNADTRNKPQPIRLAVVTPADDGWQLVERGKLRFVTDTQSIPSEKVTVRQGEQVSALPKPEINSQLQNVEQVQKLQKLKTTSDSRSQNSPKTASPEIPLSDTDRRIANQSTPDWLEMYHKSSEQLRDRVLIVDLTPNSAEQYFQGRLTHPPQFERQPNGKFWIIAGWIAANGKRFDYLVPKGNFQLKNMHNVESMKASFVCNGSDNARARIKVIQPGVVLPLGNSEQWQLEERGQLQFESSQQVENNA